MTPRQPGQTSLIDILLRCREGLRLDVRTQLGGVAYSPDSLIMLFRHEDGLIYKIEISEVKEPEPEGTKGEL